jgi:hypothetical protein
MRELIATGVFVSERIHVSLKEIQSHRVRLLIRPDDVTVEMFS